MTSGFSVYPIGVIRKHGDAVYIEIEKKYKDALLGLGGFSHILVLYWFHENDNAADRSQLQVHPRGDRKNPLTGVFATHSPIRPNLNAVSTCRMLSIVDTTLAIDKIDAIDGSPVLDIKCFIPRAKPDTELRVPDWV